MKYCPECSGPIDMAAEDVIDGAIIDCPDCEEQLVIYVLEGGGYALDLAATLYEDDKDEDKDIDWGV